MIVSEKGCKLSFALARHYLYSHPPLCLLIQVIYQSRSFQVQKDQSWAVVLVGRLCVVETVGGSVVTCGEGATVVGSVVVGSAVVGSAVVV